MIEKIEEYKGYINPHFILFEILEDLISCFEKKLENTDKDCSNYFSMLKYYPLNDELIFELRNLLTPISIYFEVNYKKNRKKIEEVLDRLKGFSFVRKYNVFDIYNILDQVSKLNSKRIRNTKFDIILDGESIDISDISNENNTNIDLFENLSQDDLSFNLSNTYLNLPIYKFLYLISNHNKLFFELGDMNTIINIYKGNVKNFKLIALNSFTNEDFIKTFDGNLENIYGGSINYLLNIFFENGVKNVIFTLSSSKITRTFKYDKLSLTSKGVYGSEINNTKQENTDKIEFNLEF